MSTIASLGAKEDVDSRFMRWLPNPVTIYVRFTSEHEQWCAEALDFEIAGIGDSPDSAREDMLRLLCAYLRSCHRDQRSFGGAHRPAGRWHRIKARGLALISRLTAARAVKVRRVTLAPGEFVLAGA